MYAKIITISQKENQYLKGTHIFSFWTAVII